MLDEFKIEEYANDIVSKFLESGKDELVIACIGTDKAIFDSLAPLTGTFIKENNKDIIVYGTLEYPIHALNITTRLKEINDNHKNSYVIGIDACLGEKVGEITLRDKPIAPAKGVGKTLPEVGDCSIIGITKDENCEFLFTSSNTRLSLVYDMAKSISKIIEITYNKLNKYSYELDDVAIAN